MSNFQLQTREQRRKYQVIDQDDESLYQPSPNVRYRKIRLYQSLDMKDKNPGYFQQFKTTDKRQRDQRMNQLQKIHRNSIQVSQNSISQKMREMAILQQPMVVQYQQRRDPRSITLSIPKTTKRKRIIAPRKISTTQHGEAIIGHRRQSSGQQSQQEKAVRKALVDVRKQKLRGPNKQIQLVRHVKELQLINIYGIQQFGSIDMAEKIFTKFTKKYKEYKKKGVQMELQQEQEYQMIVKILNEKRKKGYNQYTQILKTLSSLRSPTQLIRFIQEIAEQIPQKIQWTSAFMKISQKMLKMFDNQQLNLLLAQWQILLQKIIELKRVFGVITSTQERTQNAIKMYPLNAKLSINIKRQIHSELKELVYILWKPFDTEVFEAQLYFKLRICLNEIIDTVIIRKFKSQQEEIVPSQMLVQMLTTLKRSFADQKNDIVKFNDSYPYQQQKNKVSPRKKSLLKSLPIQQLTIHAKIDNTEQYDQKMSKINDIFNRYIHNLLKENAEDIYQSFIEFQIQRYEKKHLIQKKWNSVKASFKAVQNCLLIHQHWSKINNILFKTYMQASLARKSIYHSDLAVAVNFRAKMTTFDSLVEDIRQGRAKSTDSIERILCSYFRNCWILTKQMFQFSQTSFVLIQFLINQTQSREKHSLKTKTQEIMMVGLKKDEKKVRTQLEDLLRKGLPEEKANQFNYQQFYNQCCVYQSFQNCQRICVSLTIPEQDFIGGLNYQIDKKYQFVVKLIQNYNSDEDEGDWFVISFSILQHAIYKAQKQELSGKVIKQLQQQFITYIRNNAFLPQGQIKRLYTTPQIIDDILEMARYFDAIREQVKDCMAKFAAKQNFVLKSFHNVELSTVEDTYDRLIAQFKLKEKNKIICKNSKEQEQLTLLILKRQIDMSNIPKIIKQSFNFNFCLQILKLAKKQAQQSSFLFMFKEFLECLNSINDMSDTKAVDIAIIDICFFIKFLGFEFYYGFEIIIEQIIIFKETFDQLLATVLKKAKLIQFQKNIEAFDKQIIKSLLFEVNKSSINQRQFNLNLKKSMADYNWKKPAKIPFNIFAKQYYSEKLSSIQSLGNEFSIVNKPLLTSKPKQLYNLTQLIWKIYLNQQKKKKKIKNFPFEEPTYVNFSKGVFALYQNINNFHKMACLQLFQKGIRQNLFIASQNSEKQYQLIKFITQQKPLVIQKLQKTQVFYKILQGLVQPKPNKNKEKEFNSRFKHYYLSKQSGRQLVFIGKNQSVKEDIEKFIGMFLNPVFQKEEATNAFIQNIYRMIQSEIKWQQKQKFVEVEIQTDQIFQKLHKIIDQAQIVTDTNKIRSYIFACTFDHFNPYFPENRKMQFMGKSFHPKQKLISINDELIKKWEDQILLFDAVQILFDCQFTKIIQQQLKIEKISEQIAFKKQCIGMLYATKSMTEKLKVQDKNLKTQVQKFSLTEFIEWIRKVNTKINIQVSTIFDWSEQQKMMAMTPKIQGQQAIQFFKNINVPMNSLIVEPKHFKIKDNECKLILGKIKKDQIKTLYNRLDGSYFNKTLQSSAQFILQIVRQGRSKQQYFFGEIKSEIPAKVEIHKYRGGTQNTFQAKIIKVSILKGYKKEKRVTEAISISDTIVVGVGQVGNFQKLAQWINQQIY